MRGERAAEKWERANGEEGGGMGKREGNRGGAVSRKKNGGG